MQILLFKMLLNTLLEFPVSDTMIVMTTIVSIKARVCFLCQHYLHNLLTIFSDFNAKLAFLTCTFHSIYQLDAFFQQRLHIYIEHVSFFNISFYNIKFIYKRFLASCNQLKLKKTDDQPGWRQISHFIQNDVACMDSMMYGLVIKKQPPKMLGHSLYLFNEHCSSIFFFKELIFYSDDTITFIEIFFAFSMAMFIIF